jgi:uncharacterized protein (DUF1800 family)
MCGCCRSTLFGNYRDLLRDITLSPCMGKYLADLANSVKATVEHLAQRGTTPAS